MMKRFAKRLDSISARMLLPFLSILLVPLCFILVIYNTTMDAILISRQETALNGLKESASIMDARLEELANISSYIYTDSNTNAIINRSRFEPKKRDIYSFYQALDSLPNYKLTNQMIENIYIFFNRADFVIKQPNAFANTAENYRDHVNFHGITFEEINALSRQRYVGGPLVSEDATGRDVLMLRSIPNSATPEGLIAIQLNTDLLDSALTTNDIGPGGGAYILGKDGKILSSTGDGRFDTAFLSALSDDERYAYREIQHQGRHYLLCQVKEGGLTYLTLTDKQYLLASIAPIKTLILLLGAAALAFGVLICVLQWRQRRRVVKRITSAAQSVGIDFQAARSETHLLESTVNSLASTVGTLRETMSRQRDVLGQTVIQGCLHGAFSSRAAMMREVFSLGMDLEAVRYHVVRVSLLDPWDVRTQSAQILPYRIFLKEFIAAHLEIPHVVSDIDGTSFALLLTQREAPLSAKALAKRFAALSEQVGALDWDIPSFSISNGCTDLFDVSGLYRQTEAITRYMALLERRGVFSSEDLTDSPDVLSFSMETEIRLIHTMKGGTREEFEAVFDQILLENLEQRALGIVMLDELFEALRRSIFRAVQESGTQSDKDGMLETLSSVRSFTDLRSRAIRVREQMSRVAETHTREDNQELKARLQALIDENLADAGFTLAILAERVGISESTLYRTFKDAFGMSFSSYLEQRRINRAFELLKDQVLIKDVAEQVGYISDHTFRRAFKRVMKVPPSEFAKLSQPL